MDMRRQTGSELTALPEYIINNFLPGAQPLLQRYPRLFKVLGVVLALWYFGPLARLKSVWYQFSQYLVSTITVATEEDLFSYIITWLADEKTLQTDHTLAAITNSSPDERIRNMRRRHEMMDYEETARKPTEEPKIRYEQSGAQLFFYKRRIFYVNRTLGDGHTYLGNRYKRAEVLRISCLGRSTQPIKDFIQDIYDTNKQKEKSMTIIRRPFTGGYASRLSWSRLTSKPKRNLDTVILDHDAKQRIIKDIEEYMDESTRLFYADHGIPYRRGYLLHGEPGTGKTSFCLALAAKFDLDVYVLTLLDHDLQDSDLMSLMNQLPSPSLLLLEDIDTAGLSRKKSSSTTGMSNSSKSGRNRGRGLNFSALTGTAEANPDSDDEAPNQKATNISLSGILNAIDGVASPEGIITIMTTNKPDELDEALVRAGRISVKVEFGRASKEQSKEMFLRMYVDRPQAGVTFGKEIRDTESTSVEALAQKFAEQMHLDAFSPADLQDYLLLHKKDPRAAVESQEGWMNDMYAERERKETEKEAEAQRKAEKIERRRRRLRQDLKAAMADDEPGAGETGGASGVLEVEAEVATDTSDAKDPVDTRPVREQLKEAEAEIAAEDRSRP